MYTDRVHSQSETSSSGRGRGGGGEEELPVTAPCSIPGKPYIVDIIAMPAAVIIFGTKLSIGVEAFN